MKHIKNMLGGLTIAWLTTMLVCMIGAGLLAAGQLKESNSGYISLLSLLLSTMMGAWIVKKKTETYSWVWCLIYGIAYYMSLLCAGTLLFEGELSGGLVTALIIVGSCAAGALVGNGKKKHSILRRKAYKPRSFV